MKPALVLIDMQNDFLDSPGLDPERDRVIKEAAAILDIFRQANLSVLHVRTLLHPDGSNRMPHWVENGVWKCIENTVGAAPPDELSPVLGEWVFNKRFYSAFENPDFSAALMDANVDTLIMAGVYTHACVRSTALDAYSRGFAVRIAFDAVASAEPLHAEMTMSYLKDRSILCIHTEEIRRLLARREIPRFEKRIWQMRNPAMLSETIGEVVIAGPDEIDSEVSQIRHKQIAWSKIPVRERAEQLAAWKRILVSRRNEFIARMVQDIGKPVTYAEGEFDYALKLLAHTIGTLAERSTEVRDNGFSVQYEPAGVAGLITPWNNPLAIPVGKLAPAFAWGNGALWKPALPASRLALLLADTLQAAMPDAPFKVVTGDVKTGRLILQHRGVDFISFTGSVRQGRSVSALCTLYGKRLQAELGGNNAAIVMADADPERVACLLAPALFGFAGQRCTAPRRVIVDEKIRPVFEQSLLQEIAKLPVGNPADNSVQVGPLVSIERQLEMLKIVASAEGCILCGGSVPANMGHGAWFAPTLIADPPPGSSVVMEESFGPIAVLMTASDVEHALKLNNSVPHGLVTTLFSDDVEIRQRICDGAESGIVVINTAPAPIEPAAPFAGWKDSGLGPPEHGRWDLEFYSRPKAVYGPY